MGVGQAARHRAAGDSENLGNIAFTQIAHMTKDDNFPWMEQESPLHPSASRYPTGVVQRHLEHPSCRGSHGADSIPVFQCTSEALIDTVSGKVEVAGDEQ